MRDPMRARADEMWQQIKGSTNILYVDPIIIAAFRAQQEATVRECLEIVDGYDQDEQFDIGCRCGHQYENHDHRYDDASPCKADGCECAEFNEHSRGDLIRERFGISE